ncbi:MAG: 4Fe-4S binding protein, partial [Firmicutes bacterium]|nr:4Fe-4S binding protein [Candidatus Colimorpha enterica]
IYNDIQFGGGTLTPSMRLEDMEDKGPLSCVGCGACEQICPQKIEIPTIMAKLAEMIPSLPSWKKMCKERAEAAKKLEEEGK